MAAGNMGALSQLLKDLSLGSQCKYFAEYIWIGGGCDLHSKTRVLDFQPSCVEQLPAWHFDDDTQTDGCRRVNLRPCRVFPDPFRDGGNVLVLCDTYQQTLQPEQAGPAHPSNTRCPCASVMESAASSAPVFSVEQQFTLVDPRSQWPLGWPEQPTGELTSSFCAVGSGAVHGRTFASTHLAACVRARLAVTGTQAEHCPGQWSYRVGPCQGVELADQLWLSRYILLRVSEVAGLVATLDPNPIPGAASSAPVRFSTRETREAGSGMREISAHMHKLSCAHLHHMMLYGQHNSRRYSGQQKGGSAMLFTVGMEDYSAAIRVPHTTACHSQGYYEDRRPASNMDPYLVTGMLVSTTLGIPIPGASSAGSKSQSNKSQPPRECSGESTGTSSSSEAASRSSSALIDEIDKHSCPHGPGTPDGIPGLASLCYSSSAHSANAC